MATPTEAIQAAAAAVKEAQDRQDAAVTGVSADIDFLVAELAKVNNSPGELTPADQASLDAMISRANAAAEKLEALDVKTTPTTEAFRASERAQGRR